MTPLPRLYVANLCALLTTGVLVSGWLLYYTESFEVVGGLLGLGGVLAWAAFVVGLLTDDSKEKLQALFEASVLLRWRTMLACAVVISGMGALLFMSGTLVLDAEAAESDRMVSVSKAGDEDPVSSRVPARGVRRLWFLTPFGGTTLRVKVDGLPATDVELQPPFRARLGVPSSFLGRRLMLVRPSPRLSGSAAGSPDDHALRVILAGKTAEVHPYAGQSVWIGTDEDVPVPPELLQRWRESLTIAALSSAAGEGASTTAPLAVVETVLARWAAPRAVMSNVALGAGQQAIVEIRRRSDKHRLVGTTVDVRPPSAGDAIQEVVLE